MHNFIKVILLNPPYPQPIIRDNYCCFTSKSSYLWPPVDLLYLSATLTHPKIKLFVIDAVAQKLSPLQCRQQIKKIHSNIIISLTGTASYPVDLKFLKKMVRQNQNHLYLLGNTPSFDPHFFLTKYPFVAGIIHNFFGPNLADFFIKNSSPPSYISYRKNKKIIPGTINFLKTNTLPPQKHPPQYHLFPIKKYSSPLAQKKPLVTMLTSFGCPYQCKFCIASQLNYFSRNITDLKIEFDAIKKNNIKEIFFEDSTLNTNQKHLQSICRLMINEKYNFSWHANIHSQNIDYSTLKLMKQAGCHTLNIGVESGNPETLKKYAVTKNISTIKKTFSLCRKLKIRTLGFFIIGFPNENINTSQNTINLAIKLDPDFASFSILTPDYGTPLFQEVIQNQSFTQKKVPFDSSGSAIIKNKNFSVSEQNQVLKKAYLQFYFRPTKIIKYIFDIKNYSIYFQNGVTLIKNKILKTN